ncbi:MAG TPA: hypothetical protein PLC10_15970, partial [Flavobacteriales bacterium]|nr:hypothetical protein [Flavobacteriales bacterium]
MGHMGNDRFAASSHINEPFVKTNTYFSSMNDIFSPIGSDRSTNVWEEITWPDQLYRNGMCNFVPRP